jgi:hypothetical protein
MSLAIKENVTTHYGVENEHRFDGTQKWLGVKVIISK